MVEDSAYILKSSEHHVCHLVVQWFDGRSEGDLKLAALLVACLLACLVAKRLLYSLNCQTANLPTPLVSFFCFACFACSDQQSINSLRRICCLVILGVNQCAYEQSENRQTKSQNAERADGVYEQQLPPAAAQLLYLPPQWQSSSRKRTPPHAVASVAFQRRRPSPSFFGGPTV